METVYHGGRHGLPSPTSRLSPPVVRRSAYTIAEHSPKESQFVLQESLKGSLVFETPGSSPFSAAPNGGARARFPTGSNVSGDHEGISREGICTGGPSATRILFTLKLPFRCNTSSFGIKLNLSRKFGPERMVFGAWRAQGSCIFLRGTRRVCP